MLSETIELKVSCIVLALTLVLYIAMFMGISYTMAKQASEVKPSSAASEQVPVHYVGESHSVSHGVSLSQGFSVIPISVGVNDGLSESYSCGESCGSWFPSGITFEGYFAGNGIHGIFNGTTDGGILSFEYVTGELHTANSFTD